MEDQLERTILERTHSPHETIYETSWLLVLTKATLRGCHS